MQPPIAFDMSCPESLHVCLIVCLFGTLKLLFVITLWSWDISSSWQTILILFSVPSPPSFSHLYFSTTWCLPLHQVVQISLICIPPHVNLHSNSYGNFFWQTHMCQVPKAFQGEGRVSAGPSCSVKWRWQMTVLSVCLFSSVYNFVNTSQTANVIIKI